MNLQEMTNEQLFKQFDKTAADLIYLRNIKEAKNFAPIFLEIQRRLCAPKQPYQIKYKFLPNDRDIDDMKALTVWGTSPINACHVLVDANDWRGQSMEFQVNEYHFTSADLE